MVYSMGEVGLSSTGEMLPACMNMLSASGRVSDRGGMPSDGLLNDLSTNVLVRLVELEPMRGAPGLDGVRIDCRRPSLEAEWVSVLLVVSASVLGGALDRCFGLMRFWPGPAKELRAGAGEAEAAAGREEPGIVGLGIPEAPFGCGRREGRGMPLGRALEPSMTIEPYNSLPAKQICEAEPDTRAKNRLVVRWAAGEGLAL